MTKNQIEGIFIICILLIAAISCNKPESLVDSHKYIKSVKKLYQDSGLQNFETPKFNIIDTFSSIDIFYIGHIPHECLFLIITSATKKSTYRISFYTNHKPYRLINKIIHDWDDHFTKDIKETFRLYISNLIGLQLQRSTYLHNRTLVRFVLDKAPNVIIKSKKELEDFVRRYSNSEIRYVGFLLDKSNYYSDSAYINTLEHQVWNLSVITHSIYQQLDQRYKYKLNQIQNAPVNFEKNEVLIVNMLEMDYSMNGKEFRIFPDSMNTFIPDMNLQPLPKAGY